MNVGWLSALTVAVLIGAAAPSRAFDWLPGAAERVVAEDALVRPHPQGAAVLLGVQRRWPGVRIEAQEPWDVGAAQALEVGLLNPGDRPITVHVRVDDEWGTITRRQSIPPTAATVLRLPLPARGYVPTPGLQVVPDGLSAAGLDRSALARLVVFAERAEEPRSFVVRFVRAVASGDVQPLAWSLPLVDEQGLVRGQRPWAAKEDLVDHTPQPPDVALRPTGRFRVEQVDGRWWLVDPLGRLFWSHGVSVVTLGEPTRVRGRESLFPQTLRGHDEVNFAARNLEARLGPDWQALARQTMRQRLPAWGMNTIGLWSDQGLVTGSELPYVTWLYHGAPKISGTGLVDFWHPDLPRLLAQAAARSRLADPRLIGVFVDNELPWDDPRTFLARVAGTPADQPAFGGLLRWARERYVTLGRANEVWGGAASSWPELATLMGSGQAPDEARAFQADAARRYFSAVAQAVRAADAQVLYLCSRFNKRSPVVERVAAEYCDVLSFNLYRDSLAGFAPLDDKPVLVSEFHFGLRDHLFGGGLVEMPTSQARAEAYLRFAQQAAQHPNVVGMHWFQYRDEPATGRSLDGENYPIGFVDVLDRVDVDLVRASRRAAREIYAWRAGNNVKE